MTTMVTPVQCQCRQCGHKAWHSNWTTCICNDCQTGNCEGHNGVGICPTCKRSLPTREPCALVSFADNLTVGHEIARVSTEANDRPETGDEAGSEPMPAKSPADPRGLAWCKMPWYAGA